MVFFWENILWNQFSYWISCVILWCVIYLINSFCFNLINSCLLKEKLGKSWWNRNIFSLKFCRIILNNISSVHKCVFIIQDDMRKKGFALNLSFHCCYPSCLVCLIEKWENLHPNLREWKIFFHLDIFVQNPGRNCSVFNFMW